MIAVHLNGNEQVVTFDQLWGDKCDQVTVRWGFAGIYSVNFQTGQLLGGKPKKKASVWRLVEADLARVHVTARTELIERRERMKKA